MFKETDGFLVFATGRECVGHVHVGGGNGILSALLPREVKDMGVELADLSQRELGPLSGIKQAGR